MYSAKQSWTENSSHIAFACMIRRVWCIAIMMRSCRWFEIGNLLLYAHQSFLPDCKKTFRRNKLKMTLVKSKSFAIRWKSLVHNNQFYIWFRFFRTICAMVPSYAHAPPSHTTGFLVRYVYSDSHFVYSSHKYHQRSLYTFKPPVWQQHIVQDS